MSHGGADVSSVESKRKGGLGDGFRDQLPIAPLVASLMGTLRVLERKVKMHA